MDFSTWREKSDRLIYYVKTSTKIILITIYSKSEQEDIAAEEIQQILAEFEHKQKDKQVDND